MPANPNRYLIYLTVNSTGQKVQIPVAPAEITTDYPTDNKKYDVLDIGEIVVPRLPKLSKWSWDSFFPAFDGMPYIQNTPQGLRPPSFYQNFLLGCRNSKTVLRLIITRTMDDGSTPFFNTNTLAIIEDFSTTEKGGELGDLYYKISFSEYRTFSPRTVKFQQTASGVVALTQSARPGIGSTLQMGNPVTINGQVFANPDDATPITSLSMPGILQYTRTDVTHPNYIVDAASAPIGWVNSSALTAVSSGGN